MNKKISYRIVWNGLFNKNKKAKFKSFDCVTVDTLIPHNELESLVKEHCKKNNLRHGEGILTYNELEEKVIDGKVYLFYQPFSAKNLINFKLG